MSSYFRLISKLFILILVGFFLTRCASPVLADNEFATSYDTSYEVGVDGTTQITHKITIKNLTDQFFASNFALTVGSTNVTDITAFDLGGALEVKQEQKDNKSTISLKLNQQIVGKDKTHTLTLKYKSKDFAQNLGKVWQVNLPKIPSTSGIDSYDLSLSLPLTFGELASITPIPKSQSSKLGKYLFTFDEEQLDKSGVMANFGKEQILDFKLKYHLTNIYLYPVIVKVALPPNTVYQKVIIDSINPKPENITLDEEGNYLAWYKLKRDSKLEVEVLGRSELTLKPNQKQLALTDSQIKNYTKEDKFWAKDNPAIKTRLSEIFKDGVPKTNKEKAKLIYRSVVDSLNYNSNRLAGGNLERLGAVTALNNPDSAVCMEFTDLFITLARASKVPARYLTGYGLTLNKSLRPTALVDEGKVINLHAWPEYFDEVKGWVMVDPTWENTTGGVDYFNSFDLNHFVLAIRGSSSENPMSTDDLQVTVSDKGNLSIKSNLTVDFDISEVIKAGFPTKLKLTVKNTGNFIHIPTVLTISSGKITILDQSTINLSAIPAFGKTDLEFDLRTPSFWEEFEDNIEVIVAGQKYIKKIYVKPIFIFRSYPYLLIGVVLGVVGIYGITLGVHIHQKRKSP